MSTYNYMIDKKLYYARKITEDHRSAAIKLCERYETISLNEIKRMFKNMAYPEFVLERLTGFGDMYKCMLCTSIKTDCLDCIYMVTTASRCTKDANAKSFDRLSNANTPKKILNAYRNRAKHLRFLLEKYDNAEIEK